MSFKAESKKAKRVIHWDEKFSKLYGHPLKSVRAGTNCAVFEFNDRSFALTNEPTEGESRSFRVDRDTSGNLLDVSILACKQTNKVGESPVVSVCRFLIVTSEESFEFTAHCESERPLGFGFDVARL